MDNRDTRIGAFWLVVISGLMWAASFPPMKTGFLAFFFLVPMWFVVENIKRGGTAFRYGYLWGFVAALGTLWWIYVPTLPGMIALVLFLPLYSALYIWLHYQMSRKNPTLSIIISPIIFVAVEYIRSYGRLGFPWMNISYSQTSYPLLIQFADIFGNFGVSLWIAAINSCVYFIVKKPLSKSFWLAVGIFLILVGSSISYGIYRINRQIEGEELKIALLQGNIDPYKKWTRKFLRENSRIYSSMLRSVGERRVDLCIMPETATACYHRINSSMFSPILDAVMSIGTPTLTGSLDFEDANRKIHYNTALLIMPDGSYEQEYEKIQLVPFSEEVPFQEKFPALMKLNYGGSHFSRGKEFFIFHFDSTKFSVFICYESIFGWMGRKFRNEGAQFFVNITNDGWFGKTPGPYQHAMFNVMRAIENRCWIARCANTGISMFIDPKGVIRKKTPLFQRTLLEGEILATNQRTTYDAIGDVAGWGALIAALFLLPFFFVKTK
ncbi:apolipoprotein N-acyltransferase [bacterium]|nr:apolipoprotein N-acyltransferase [bacterium]